MGKNKSEIMIWGSLQIYYPFKFSYTRSKKYDKKHSKLLDQDIVMGFYEESTEGFLIKNTVSEYFEKKANSVTDSMHNNLSENLPEGLVLKPYNFNQLNGENAEFDQEEHYLSVIGEGSGFKLGVMSSFLDNLYDFKFVYEKKIEHDSIVYGKELANQRVNRYMLFPIRAYYKENKYFFNVSLEIFSNKSGIIKVDIPIEEINGEKLYSYEFKKVFEKISLPECLVNLDNNIYEYMEIPEKSIDEIINKYYIQYLFTYFDIDVYLERGVESLLITQTNFSLKTLNSMNGALEEALYRILHRPIDARIMVKDKLAKIKNDYWGSNQYRIYFSENGNSLSLTVNNDLVNLEDEEEKKLAREKIKLSLNHSLDVPLKMILLQRLNNYLLYKESTLDIRKIEIINEHYLANKIYISNLTEEFYGSALDLLDYMKKNMRWYLNEEEITEKNSDIQDLILSKKERKKDKQSGYLTIIGFVFTVIFALPTLKETFEVIIKKLNPLLDIEVIEYRSNLLSFYSWLFIMAIQLIMTLYFNFQNVWFYLLRQKSRIRGVVNRLWNKFKPFLKKIK